MSVNTAEVPLIRGSEQQVSLAYLRSDSEWHFADSLGQIYKLDAAASEPVDINKQDIRCWAISPHGDQCVIAVGDTVDLHEYPSFAEKSGMIVRNTLPINHIEFGHDGENV